MSFEDVNGDGRRAWLREEQEPRVRQHVPQSNFEESPHWRICLLIAVIVIGINVFSPDPDVGSGAQRAHPLRSQAAVDARKWVSTQPSHAAQDSAGA